VLAKPFELVQYSTFFVRDASEKNASQRPADCTDVIEPATVALANNVISRGNEANLLKSISLEALYLRTFKSYRALYRSDGASTLFGKPRIHNED
jgi:hypothetical protein